jgi:hypothetical protein
VIAASRETVDAVDATVIGLSRSNNRIASQRAALCITHAVRSDLHANDWFSAGIGYAAGDDSTLYKRQCERVSDPRD